MSTKSMQTRSQEQRLRNVLDTIYDAFVGVDQNGIIIEWNSQAENMFGWLYVEAIGKKMDEMIIPIKFRDAHHRGMQRFIESGHAEVLNKRIQLEAIRKNGELFPTEMTITFISNEGSYEFYAFIQDISNRITEEEKLRFLASNDPLTGLYNRAYFNTALHEAMARCRRNNTNLGLMYLDIDHFKSVNDNLGHEAGDNLLKEFAAKLKNKLREVDIVSRLGGDEFTVILEGPITDESIGLIARNLLQEFYRGEWLNSYALKITSSIGITIYDGRQVKPDCLIALADNAMYKAKHSGRNNFKLLRFEDVERSIDANSSQTNSVLLNNAKQLLSISEIDDAKFFQNTLLVIRRHLDMDVAFISRLHDGVREFEVIDSKNANPPITVGDSGPLEESYCQRVIDGRLPEIINDTFELSRAMSLPVTALLQVRAQLSVPIKLSNGEIYGTLCCFSYKANQMINERDISIMHVFADLISQQISKLNSYH